MCPYVTVPQLSYFVVTVHWQNYIFFGSGTDLSRCTVETPTLCSADSVIFPALKQVCLAALSIGQNYEAIEVLNHRVVETQQLPARYSSFFSFYSFRCNFFAVNFW
jgi:hypothetical protein